MNLKLISVLAAGLLSAAPAYSAVTLDFEDVTSFDSVGALYGSLGVSFGADALGFKNDATTTFFSNAPSPLGAMSAVGDDATMNVARGFKGTASFQYSSSEATTVELWSDVDGTGTKLGTFNLSANAQNGCSDSPYCFWSLAEVNFSGIARSIVFGSAANVAGFDNVTFAPVPLPAAGWLLLSALGGLGAWSRRKQGAVAAA